MIIPGYYEIEEISPSLPVSVYSVAALPDFDGTTDPDKLGVILQDGFDVWHIYPYSKFKETAKIISAIPPDGVASLKEIDNISVLKSFARLDGPTEGLCFSPDMGFGYFITQDIYEWPRLSIVFPVDDQEYVRLNKHRGFIDHNTIIKRNPVGYFDHTCATFRSKIDFATMIEGRSNNQPDWKKGDIEFAENKTK